MHLSGSTCCSNFPPWFGWAAIISVFLTKTEVLLLILLATSAFVLFKLPGEVSAKLGSFLDLACLQTKSTKKLKGGK